MTNGLNPLPQMPAAVSSELFTQPGKLGTVQAPANYSQDSITEIETHDPRRIVISVEGRQKRGKTHFALTAPGAVYIQNLDTGLEFVIDKFKKETAAIKKQFFGDVYPVKASASDADWQFMWRKFQDDFSRAIALPYIKTIVVDTATEAWELARLAHFGGSQTAKSHHYGPVNTDFRAILREALAQNTTNVIFIQKQKERYVNDKNTGEYEAAGFKDLPFTVQAIIECHRQTVYAQVPGNTSKPSTSFYVTINDCRMDPSKIGVRLDEPINTFQFLAAMLVPGTKPEDWA